jgi:single-strand DNA-binding protein
MTPPPAWANLDPVGPGAITASGAGDVSEHPADCQGGDSTMDNVVVGHLCQDPILRQPRRGSRPVARFTVAVNVWRRVGETFVERPPVFHRVVCFGPMAENVTNTLRKGMEVVAVGEWVDDSYSDEVGQRRVQVAMEAKAVGPGLRWATASVRKTERKSEGQDPTTDPTDGANRMDTRADATPADVGTGRANPPGAPAIHGAPRAAPEPAARVASVADPPPPQPAARATASGLAGAVVPSGRAGQPFVAPERATPAPEAAEPTASIEPWAPVEPAAAADPRAPAKLAASADPRAPAASVEPAGSVEPAVPGGRAVPGFRIPADPSAATPAVEPAGGTVPAARRRTSTQRAKEPKLFSISKRGG